MNIQTYFGDNINAYICLKSWHKQKVTVFGNNPGWVSAAGMLKQTFSPFSPVERWRNIHFKLNPRQVFEIIHGSLYAPTYNPKVSLHGCCTLTVFFTVFLHDSAVQSVCTHELASMQPYLWELRIACLDRLSIPKRMCQAVMVACDSGYRDHGVGCDKWYCNSVGFPQKYNDVSKWAAWQQDDQIKAWWTGAFNRAQGWVCSMREMFTDIQIRSEVQTCSHKAKWFLISV